MFDFALGFKRRERLQKASRDSFFGAQGHYRKSFWSFSSACDPGQRVS